MSQDVRKTLIAIYDTLKEFLPEPAVFKAMLYYERNFAAEASFSVAHFLKKVCDVEGIPTKRNEIMQVLVAKLHFDKQMSNPQVALDYQNFKKSQKGVNETVKSCVEVVVFQSLLVEILKQVDGRDRNQLESYAVENADDYIADQDFRDSFNAWLTRQKKGLNTPQVSYEDLQGGINVFYVGLCGQLGPVETDMLLSRAKSVCSQKLSSDQRKILNKIL